MKRRFTLALVLLFALAASAQQLYVGTYNIRNNASNDDELEGNGWSVRQQVVCDQINFESPDIFGAEEVVVGQLHDMLRRCTGYSYLGVGRDDGREAGEYSAIFYKKDKLRLLHSGHFWLNETPDKPALGWDAACVRICTWGEFKDRSTKLRFFFFALHMDHVGVVARRESAKLIVQKIRELAGTRPVVVVGDFNVDQNDDIFQVFVQSGLLKDSYVHARQRFAENGTFNAFRPSLKSDSRIDHIFVSPQFEVEHYGILTNMYWKPVSGSPEVKGKDAPQEIGFRRWELRTPSDHYPVFVKLRYRK
ncbi:endonuclease/exonuclease/phosphatase family protein [Prevotella sp. kh1p2]|uniref:endonuclease/exonuclease/phosphatase family protein n=1 Tax=Prevotella sp. kh1p2 TaxID=1761883 RepID=UPI0008B742EF|nr:endonuclease/exonuclease/phosphatase family protein [Prevotella sp. kh1p2]SES95893.1 Metal-dependent hydrolase, endonuclease/exonuclease/phosphatase family [Prevotella sp. kh1p2]SNU11311.1 Metal-dependent hydrolase, endonuclease/exonuclease/phosphatase family [Prevotellaceae bacterium KH2P17]